MQVKVGRQGRAGGRVGVEGYGTRQAAARWAAQHDTSTYFELLSSELCTHPARLLDALGDGLHVKGLQGDEVDNLQQAAAVGGSGGGGKKSVVGAR
jgi:hypothetical protein